MTALPPEAVRRAALVLSCAEGEYDEDDYRVAGDMLEAAAPAIRAAERGRLRQLCGDGSDVERKLSELLDEDDAIDVLLIIADLLGDPPPGQGGNA